MTLTYGFYNSLNGDRKYDATQFGNLFEGIINDGVFMSKGERFAVKAFEGFSVKVGSGRAWLNGTWTFNDSDSVLTLSTPDQILPRIDAVILQIDKRKTGRQNSLAIVTGTPEENPIRPKLVKENDLYQYPLAYILVKARATSILQADITNMVGTGDLPFVTGILKTMDITMLVDSWESAFQVFMSNKALEFNKWFDTVQTDISGDLGATLTLKVNKALDSIFNLQYNLISKDTEVVKDVDGNTTITETSSEGVAVTTFEKVSNTSKRIRTVITPTNGELVYEKITLITKYVSDRKTKIQESFILKQKGAN